MKKYEAVFILDMRKVEDEGKAFSEEFAQMIQSWGGSVVESNAMGRKQFAREIRKRPPASHALEYHGSPSRSFLFLPKQWHPEPIVSW